MKSKLLLVSLVAMATSYSMAEINSNFSVGTNAKTKHEKDLSFVEGLNKTSVELFTKGDVNFSNKVKTGGQLTLDTNSSQTTLKKDKTLGYVEASLFSKDDMDLSAKAEYRLDNKLTIGPKFTYEKDKLNIDSKADFVMSNFKKDEIKGEVNAKYDINDDITVEGGVNANYKFKYEAFGDDIRTDKRTFSDLYNGKIDTPKEFIEYNKAIKEYYKSFNDGIEKNKENAKIVSLKKEGLNVNKAYKKLMEEGKFATTTDFFEDIVAKEYKELHNSYLSNYNYIYFVGGNDKEKYTQNLAKEQLKDMYLDVNEGGTGANVKVTYKKLKDIELSSKFKFDYKIKNMKLYSSKENKEKIYTNKKDELYSPGIELAAKYTGLENTNLNAKIGYTYDRLKSNTNYLLVKKNSYSSLKIHRVKLNLDASYEAKLMEDKLTLIPKLETETAFDYYFKRGKEASFVNLKLTPSVEAKVKLKENLTLNSMLSLEENFGMFKMNNNKETDSKYSTIKSPFMHKGGKLNFKVGLNFTW